MEDALEEAQKLPGIFVEGLGLEEEAAEATAAHQEPDLAQGRVCSELRGRGPAQGTQGVEQMVGESERWT